MTILMLETVDDGSPQIGVGHLRSLYDRAMGSRAGRAGKKSEEDWINDNIVMCGLGLPLEVTISFLFSDGPSPDRRRYPLIAQSINVFPTTRSENMEWA